LRNLLLNIFSSSGHPEKNTFNKNLTAFLFCLVISAFCWFLIVLSKDYHEKPSFKVVYTNLPQDRALINRLPDSVQMDISTSGFAMLRERLFGTKSKVEIDCSKLKTGNDGIGFLATAGLSIPLASQLGADYNVLHIYPDTLFFNFGARASKTVPVRLNLNLGFEKQYQLSDSIRMSPSRVTVYGSREIIEKITQLNTEYRVLGKLDKTVTLRLGFAEGGRGLGFSTDSITVTVPVDRFTEGNQEVTVTAVNLPEGYSLKLFPDKVNLRYLVGISDLSRVSPNSFRVVVDYAKASETGGSRLRAEVLEAPGFVNSIKVDPEKIEYILRKLK
jgi:hypothetical protein